MPNDLEDLIKKAQDFFNKGFYHESLGTILKAKSLAKKQNKVLFSVSLGILGDVLTKLNKFDEAEKNYKQALRLHKKLASNNSFYYDWVITTLINYGNLFLIKNHPNEAIGKYEECQKLIHKIQNPKNSIKLKHRLALSYENLGLNYRNNGDFENSKLNFNKSIQLYKELKNKDDNFENTIKVAKVIGNLGNLFAEMNYSDKAIECMKESIRLYESQTIVDSSIRIKLIAMQYMNLGGIYYNLGKFNIANENYIKSYKFFKELPQDELSNFNFEFSDLLHNWGILLNSLNDFENAKSKLELCIQLGELLEKSDKSNIVNLEKLANAYNSLAGILVNLSDLESAEKLFKKSHNKVKQIYENNPNSRILNDLIMTYNNLGMISKECGNFQEAEHYYKEGINFLEKNQFENYSYQSDKGLFYNNLGTLYKDIKNYESAEEYLMKSFKIRYDLLQSNKENIHYLIDFSTILLNLGLLYYKQDELSKSLHYLNWSLDISKNFINYDLNFKIYSGLGDIYSRNGDFSKAFENYNSSIENLNQLRSQNLQEIHKIDTLKNKIHIFPKIINLLISNKKFDLAFEYLEKSKSRSFLDFIKNSYIKPPKEIPNDLILKEQKIIEKLNLLNENLLNSLNHNKIKLEIEKINDDLFELQDIIKQYSEEYVDIRRGNPVSYNEIMNILSNQEKNAVIIEYYPLSDFTYIFILKEGAKEPIVEKIELKYDDLIKYVKDYFGEFTDFSDPQSGYNWQELANYLIKPLLTYIEDKELVYIVPHGPLHYLPFHALRIEDKYFIEQFLICYLPSTSIIRYIKNRENEKLITCLPIGYTPKSEEREIFNGESIKIAEIFNTKPYIDNDATIKLIEKKTDTNIIHFSCHGAFYPENPLESGIRLHDGILNVKKILSLNLDSKLVVLSACETGLNEINPGDELIGLTRSLLYSGISSLIVTLWSVDAVSTKLFMEIFYEKIKQGKSIVESLQYAQIEFIKNQDYNNPYFWAPFVLIGNWK